MSSSEAVPLRVQQCACYGGNLERFVRPLLLAHLARTPEGRHGYALLSDLELFYGAAPDASGLYRALRSLEAEGMTTSHTAEEADGPARRVYRLTESGRACLHEWSNTLRDYAAQVQRVADFCGSAG